MVVGIVLSTSGLALWLDCWLMSHGRETVVRNRTADRYPQASEWEMAVSGVSKGCPRCKYSQIVTHIDGGIEPHEPKVDLALDSFPELAVVFAVVLADCDSRDVTVRRGRRDLRGELMAQFLVGGHCECN
jgi:hypothetical protein